jgi:hypothetical protein
VASRLSVRRGRRAPGTFRLKKPVWIDPFPQIPGTEPEKRIFEALYRRRIYFIFQGNLPEFDKHEKLVGLAVPGFKPDFVLPEYRLIIDPFGVFHHSLPDAVKRDAFKSVWYRALGYEFIHPWWDERGFTLENAGTFTPVGYDANAILDSSVNLRRGPTHKLTDPKDIAAKRSPGYRIGVNLGAGANSVAIANHKRTRPHGRTLGAAGRRRRSRRR